jgi:hypothetical protein
MKGVQMSPRKNKGTPGMAALARGENNESPKTKKNNPSARAPTRRVADDASDEDSGDPPYKPRLKTLLTLSWMMTTTTQ